MNNDYFTLDDNIRFESISDDGIINATHLIIRRAHGDEAVIFDKIYTTSSIVYKISKASAFN